MKSAPSAPILQSVETELLRVAQEHDNLRLVQNGDDEIDTGLFEAQHLGSRIRLSALQRHLDGQERSLWS